MTNDSRKINWSIMNGTDEHKVIQLHRHSSGFLFCNTWIRQFVYPYYTVLYNQLLHVRFSGIIKVNESNVDWWRHRDLTTALLQFRSVAVCAHPNFISFFGGGAPSEVK
jgi:hypothetical protein